MNTRFKIESQISTYLSEDFFRVLISCHHNYYIDGVCMDLSFELTRASKDLLKANDIFFKENGPSLFVGRKKSRIEGDEAINSILFSSLPIYVQLKVTNPRFWSVTDFALIKAPPNPFKSENPLIFRYEDKEEISECSIEELSQEEKLQHNLGDLPKEIFGILIIDLKKIAKQKLDVKLKLEAPEIKLKYKVIPIISKEKKKKRNGSEKRLNIDDVLVNKKILKECCLEKENRLELSVKNMDGFYLIESTKNWSMRQENPHQNPEFFKFEVEVEDSEKAKEGKADIFLPFPSRIKPNLFKKEGEKTILEQKVSLLRFGAKPGPKK